MDERSFVSVGELSIGKTSNISMFTGVGEQRRLSKFV
jgi:hypothetical protein